MVTRTLSLALFVFLTLSPIALVAQQVPDTSFVFPPQPANYNPGSGPVVAIDDAHGNFHTLAGGFSPFGAYLRRLGFRTIRGEDVPESGSPSNPSVFVIANALHPDNSGHWRRPIASAFTAAEIASLAEWVRGGGRLLLIADHMPFAGAAAELGKAFGITWLDGFAQTGNSWPPTVFRRAAGLPESPVTEAREGEQAIDSVATFTGSAFRIRAGIPVLAFAAGHRSLQPDQAWEFSAETPTVDLDGYLQGALVPFGKGRVAVFGEAAMFTAQLAGGIRKVGFNSPEAPENLRFIARVMEWLTQDI